MGHIVGAITQVRQTKPIQRALALGQCLQISEYLARMKIVGEGIDNGYGGTTCHGGQALLRVGTPHDGFHVARQHLPGVLQGLFAPELSRAAIDDHRVPAQLRDTHFERESGSRGVFLEDDGYPMRPLQRAPRERRLLEFGCQREDFGLFGR